MPPSPFAGLFGPNPFSALQRHMAVVVKCAAEVEPLFEALIAGDKEEVARLTQRINELEEEADKVKHDIRVHLPRSLFLPVDRRDLLEILHAQDAIADVAQDIAGIFVERDMELPEGMHADIRKLVKGCIGVVNHAHIVVNRLDELVEVGFKGRQVDQVEVLLSELNSLEDATDQAGIELTRTLFSLEDSMRPVSVMLWYRLIEWIGDLADNAEKVGNRLRLVIAR